MKLNLKEWMAKVSTWIANINTWKSSTDTWIADADGRYVNTTGDTMTGDLVVSTSNSTSRVRVTTSATNIVLAAQNGGHHGLWSDTLSKWIVYGLTGGIVKVNETEIPASATLLTDSSSSVTATKVGNYYSGSGITAMKNGGCVTINVSFTASASFTSRTTVATIPAGYRPMGQTFGYRNGTTEFFVIESNGDVKFNSLTSGSTYYGVATYCKA